MTLRLRVALLLIAVAAFAIWKSQLFLVARPGDRPMPLKMTAEPRAVAIDAVLPSVPFGAVHVRSGEVSLLIHYWAPWERHAARQAADLDSLLHSGALSNGPGAATRVAMVSFDPFPSLSRYVARQRLRLPVLLDLQRSLANQLPCPSVPYTYVVDSQGRIVVAQPGEVDWLSPATLETLRRAQVAATDSVGVRI